MRNLKEETFYLASYFDSRMRGLDDNYQTSDATEAEDWAWEHLNQGGYVEIKNQKTGKEVYLDPDDLLDDYADYASGAFEDAINDSGVLEEDMGREIKRYSDVYSDERRNQGWWYFTTHGVQPGSVPKDVNILEVRDTPNGTYFRVDAILNTSELEYYDIKERVPKQEESLKEDASMDSAQRLEDDGWVVLSHGVRGGDNNFYWLARRMNKERGKADWKAINDKTGEVIDITYEQALEREPIGVSSGVSKLSKNLGKAILPQKINIRESLNKYDLRTDNKYDLRNLYDACIMTDKEKRIIAEMIAKNTRANVLYEALMNKFEGKELEESNYAMPEKYITNELCNKTDKQSLKNAYDRNELSVIVKGGMWYTEGCPSRLFNTLKREMKKYYPYLEYLYDVTPPYKNESLKESKSDKALLSDIRTIFRNVPKDLWVVDKSNGEITLYVENGIHRYWYAMKDLFRQFDCEEGGEDALHRSTYLIKGKKPIKEEIDLNPEDDESRRLERVAKPLALALDNLNDRDDGFYITYSIGMDDNGTVTGGVDFELFKSSRTEDEAKAEIERVFDENGFELDRRYKTNPGKTLFGRTHYQIIEKEK